MRTLSGTHHAFKLRSMPIDTLLKPNTASTARRHGRRRAEIALYNVVYTAKLNNTHRGVSDRDRQLLREIVGSWNSRN